jgi:TolB-like protein/Tfp pilus assembly protein PilF/predicted Ser/Thr protein kinase
MSDPLHSLAVALGDRYRVERELGQGGMATVYLARDLKHDREVAIKVMKHEVGDEGGERFLREVRIVARLTHPHILPLHDSGIADGLPYFVMPFMRGESLRQVLERRGRLAVDEAVDLISRVAYAVAYAHGQGVIHRDIKPENILLHEGEPVLADFGVALGAGAGGDARDPRRTATGIAVGTPLYMSPEQALGQADLDPRSDVYALGCVLHEMLTGEPPMMADSFAAMVARRLSGPVPSVIALRPDLTPGVDSALRRALAPDRAERFATPVAFAEALTAPGVARPRAPVVAVLPFRNINADAEAACFAEGMAEDVIAHLAKLHTLDVIARASVAPYRERTQRPRAMAAELGATALLDGSVRRAGNRVRVVAELVDGMSEQQLWAETYDGDLTDIFAIQTDVALKIAAAMRVVLTPEERTRVAREPTADVVAYERYLLGRQQLTKWTQSGMHEGVRLLTEATTRDPSFAQAHAQMGLAWSELLQNDEGDREEAYANAVAAAQRALAIDPDVATAHTVLGHLSVVHDFAWAEGERRFKRALEIEPGNADTWDLYGRYCYAIGRFDEGLVMVQRAHALDPVAHRSDVPTAYLRARRFDEALTVSRSLLDADPGHERGHMTLGWALFFLGRHDEALAAMREAMRIAPDKSQWMAQYGEALGLAGRTTEARAELARLEAMARERYVSPYHMAYVYVGLGELDRAMDALDRAYDARSGSIHSIGTSFLLEPLFGHPRFAGLLQKINFPG